MASGFNLTAEINLRGPSNIKNVVSGIRRQLGTIGVNVSPSVKQSDIRNIATDIRSRLANINIPINVTASNTSIKSLAKNIRSGLSNINAPVSITVSQRSIAAARRSINTQLSNINTNINVSLNPASIRNATALNRNLINLTQTLNQITTSATSAAAAIRDLSTAMSTAAGGSRSLAQINTSLNVVSNNAANTANNMRQLTGEVEGFGRQAGLAIRRFAAYSSVTAIFFGLARSIQSGISAFVEFDRQLVRLSQVTGDSRAGLSKLEQTIGSLSRAYGVSSQQLATVSVTLAQAGLTAKQTEQALGSLARTALAPSFDDLNNTVEGSIALMRQFGISTKQLEQALGSINAVAAGFAVEAGDIIAAIQRTGGVFAAASKGVSEGTDALNEFVAVFTSVRATTRESAETIATGLRTIFTRIQRGSTIEALKDFGVNLTDVEGKFVGAYKAIELLSTGLSRLDPRDLRFSQIVEELGGFRQIGKVIPLIQQFSTAQQALNVAQAGSGSLAEDASKGQLALAVQIAKVKEEFLSLIRSVGDTSSFRTLVKLGLDLASSLIQVADAAKELLPLIGAFAAFRGAQAVTRFAAGFAGGLRGTPPRGFAGGGYVPGSGNRDTVPAMLTPGEFVIRKKAVEKIGVGSLSRLNRNNGGPVPTQYFEDGGQVQRFGIGGRASRKGIDWKSLSKGRGKRGPRGPRARFDLPEPGDKDFAKWQREIYAEYDADPSLPRVTVNGIPMPPEIAYVNQLIGEEVFRQNFRSGRRKKTGKLKKTPLGLFISAANMRRGPRAPAGEMEKIMAGYQKSPEFQKKAGGAGSSLFATLKGPLASFKKNSKTGGTFGGVITPGSDNAIKIKESLGKLLSQSSGQDAIKAKTALNKFDSFIAGGTPDNPGQVAHFTWAMNQIFKRGIATFNKGGQVPRGYIQKFTNGKKVKRSPIPVSDEMKANIESLQQAASNSILSQNRVGLAILKPPKTQFKDTFIKKSNIIKSVGSQYSELLKTSLANQSIVVDKESLSQQAYADFDQAIENGLVAGVDKAASSLYSKYPLPKTPVSESAKQAFISGINNAAKGNLFEQILSSMKNQGKWDINADPQAPFDFVGGMGSASTLFPKVGGLKYVDAKAANVSDSSIALKIANQTLRDIGVVSGKKQPKQQLTNVETGVLSKLPTTAFKPFIVKTLGSDLIKDIETEIGSTRLFFKSASGFKSRVSTLSEGLRQRIYSRIQSIPGNNLGGFIQKFAIGGKATTISSDRARSAILGKQLSGAEMIKAAKRVGYDIEELDNGLVQLSRNNKIMHVLSRSKASELLGSMITGYNGGGLAKAPLIDDIANASGTLLPRPGSAVAALIRAGGGAVDVDRTLKRTIGDKAYSMAKTPGQQTAALEKYFRDPRARLTDIKSAPLTAFGQELRKAIKSGQLQPNRLSIISKSQRTPGVAEYLSQLFGIPVANMIFTQGASKQPALDALRTKGPRANRIRRYSSGGGVDTVPALLTPGEFVINKKAAARLGSSKLHQLNKADKISGFNTGGEVGRVPTFSSGGDVQRFFWGGRASARPGAEANTSNLMIAGNVSTQLREIVSALQELGVASSASADILRRGGRISVEAANAAYEADILRMRVAGAPMDAVIQAETRLAEMRRQGQQQIAAQRQLSGVGGAQLERIDNAAQQNIQRMIQRAQAAGVDLNENQRRRIEDVGYRRAAQAQGLSGTQMAGLAGNDIRQFINTAMGDPRTFEQMNRQFEARRRAELNNQYIAENRFGGDRRRILQQASRDAQEEARIRRQTLNQTRGAAGPGGTTGQRMQQGMFMASFAIPMLAQMLAGDPSRATSASGAAMSAGIQGGANTIALGSMLSSLVPPGLPQLFVGVATAAGAVAQGLIDARNATIEFEKNMAAKKVEFALADTAKLFDKLSKDIKNIDVQNAIGEKLVEASKAAERSIEIQSNTAKAFWVNMIDAFASNGKEAAQRAQILEKYGTTAYLSTTAIGQSFMGGSDTAENRAAMARSTFALEMAPEQARDIARQFSEIADNSNRLLEEKIRSGLNIEDYINTDEFKGLSQAIALSNAAIAEQILNIRASTVLTQAQKSAQEQLIITTYAEQEARKRAAVVSRELEIKAAQKAANQLARSLDRMFGNMEQAINKTSFGLEKMSRDLDLVSASLTGQARLGETLLQSINVLQNPRAYGGGELNRARSQAAGFFGESGNIVKGLLTLGDDIEANIMSTINKALKDNTDDSPGRIAIAIEKSVKTQLANLALPKDVSEKLAREVSRALEDIRKEGDDQADFTQLEEKLQGLNRIIDSTTKAQEIAIKALENWQNALNSYSSSMNALVDLQIDYQSRLRKSNSLLLEGQDTLAKALGRDISVESLVNRRNAATRQQTGGVVSPQDIFRNINRLELIRTQQENAANVAAQQGPSAIKDFIDMENNLRATNVALRENFDALKNLAENSDIASAALNKIQEAQQRQQGKVTFIEKLVTSTPEELNNLNRAFIRLQNNMNGQVNTIDNSVGAQKAYIESIKGGASAFEAIQAAQAAFANERRETLSALNDLLPFLGGGQRANQIRANTLEAMLTESGVGASPMFQDILNALRNPELDPDTQRAIALYEQANLLQVQANDFLAQINLKLGEETADKAAQAIATALSRVVLTFKNAEQADINRGLIPQNRAQGGIIYAAKGAFTPKGTDTVPAMLTPGEFVVNKNATAKNLPLLKSINSQKLSSGGQVKYYARGGLVSSYLSANALTKEDFQQTKEEFLDLTQNENLFKSTTRASLFRLPSTYIRKPEAGLQTPDKSAAAKERYDETPNKYDLKQLYSNSGDILPGYVTSKIDIGTRYYDVPSLMRIPPSELGRFALPVSLIPAGEKTTILGLDSIDTDVKTTQYNKKDFNAYKKKIESLNIDRFNWINNPASSTLRSLQNIKQEYPTSIDPTQLDNRYLNPNSRQKFGIVYSSDTDLPPSITPFKYAKILSDNGPDYYGITTGSVGTDPPNAEFIAGPSLSKVVGTMSGQAWNIDKNKTISPQKSKEVLDYNRKQFLTIGKTVEAAKNNFKNVALEDSAELNDYFKLQEQLGNLYNNLSVFENFNRLNLFAGPLLSGANSLTVLSNNAISRSDIKKYIQNQQAQLQPGDIPTNNGNPITVGLSDVLPADLQRSTNKWVKKTEFDIFSRDGTGPVKRFPFLINADVRDLGEGFIKRAEDAIQAQKSAIDTSMVVDNNKIKIQLGAGKSVDLPYSSTYTKYSGPLWDLKNNIFSDDPNNQLKDIFMPDTGPEKSVFANLDTNSDRLFKQGSTFDLNNVTQKIPLNSINKLIDLVKNDGDKNLIDKEVQNIKNQSSLTFDHIGNFEGSLIKLQRAVGKEVFVGYSQLPDTTIGFGDFVAQGIIDYAKNLKQEAGIAAGKAQGAAQPADVINDVPMALAQLTQGALQIFGSRPIPGLARGWFGGSIRPLLGLMSRQRRGRGAALTNDQARNAAAYIKNIMNNAGSYVSSISSRVTNPLLYNGLKDTFTLMWGAYKSFDSLSRSDTKQLAQLLKSNIDVESIFRSFGSAAMFDKVAMSELSGDYKAILGQQLQGSKIATVDDNGNIKLQEAAQLEFKNYKELMGLAINPYSEFRSIDIRKNIFTKLMDDIAGAVDNRGMPYFEPNTLNFLLTSLDQLRKWYGGSGGWLGQDYLFDKTLAPDPAVRSQKFLDSLKNAQGIYGLSNVAYKNLGGSSKFGRELPAEEWFKNRIDAGNFATGGMVYASSGTLVNYEPRGTDTVPAMLTPGEFVVNRSATRKNLPLLKQINNGYLAEGGMAEVSGSTRLRWTPEGRTRITERKDTITPKLNIINRNILDNASGIKSIQKDVSDLTNTLKNIESPTQAINLLSSQVFQLQNLAQTIPSFIYDQLIVVLRNLWNTLGPAITQALGNPGAWPPAPFSQGGPVYASKGQLINFQPKGTDTVPAMLTPGEFVVNAKATKNNLGLLQSINQGVGGYSRGGVVYLQTGGRTVTSQEPYYSGPMIVSGGTKGFSAQNMPVISDKDKEQIYQQHQESLNKTIQPMFNSADHWNSVFEGLRMEHSQNIAPILHKNIVDWNEYGILGRGVVAPTPKEFREYEISIGREIGDDSFMLSPAAVREYQRYHQQYYRVQQKMLDSTMGEKSLESFGFGLLKGILPTLAFMGAAAATSFTGPGAIPAGIAASISAAQLQEFMLNLLVPTTNEYMNNVASRNQLANVAGAATSGVGLTGGLASLGRNIPRLSPTVTKAIGGTGKLGWSTKSAGAGFVMDAGMQYLATGEFDPAISAINTLSSGFIPGGRRFGNNKPKDTLTTTQRSSAKPSSGLILKTLDLDSDGQIPASVSKSGREFMHMAIAEAVGYQEFMNLLKLQVRGSDRTYAKLIKFLALDIFPEGNGRVNSFEEAINFLSTKEGREFYDKNISQKLGVVPRIGGYNYTTVNQAMRSGKQGVTTRLLKAIVDADKFQIDTKHAYVPDDFNKRFADVLGKLSESSILYDNDLPKLLSQAGVTPKIDSKKVDYLIATGESGKDFGRLSEAQRSRFTEFSNPKRPPKRGSGRSRGNRNQDRIENIDRQKFFSSPNPQSIRENIGRAFGSVVGSKKEQIIRNIFNSVAGQVARSSPEFSVNQLTALLNNQITTSGAIKTIADVTRLLGLSPENVIPENLSLAIREASSAQSALGVWQEALGTMVLARPNKNVSNDNRTVAHEVGHSLLRRFGDQVYGNFQNKMQQNIGLIREYMIERPDLFRSYDKSTIGAGLAYTLKGIVPLRGPSDNVRSAVEAWANLYNNRDNLPLTAEQLQKLNEFYTKFKAGDTISPDVMSSYDINMPNMPKINASDITPDGKLDGFIRGRAIAIKEIIDLSSGDASPANLEKIKALYDQFQIGANFNDNVAVAREEFLTQMLQNVDKLDTKGLRILTELLDGTLKETGLFDANSFYDRMRNILNQRSRIPGQPPPLPGTSITIPPRMEQQTPLMRKNGGVVYASKGQLIPYEPRGTDTVPAMLTPGEFVVNRAATQKNLPLLKAINNGVGGYSDGGVVYLAAGGRPGAQQANAQTTASDRRAVMDLKGKITNQMRYRSSQQMTEANKNRQGTLWAFSTKVNDADGNQISGFVLRDPNNPNKPADAGQDAVQTESLMANRLDQIFTIRAKNEKEAMEAYRALDLVGLLPDAKPIPAMRALDQARRQWMSQPLYGKILDELAYQISLDPSQFAVFNPNFFNPAVNVDANTKPIIDAANAIDPNNPQSIALGVPVILSKLKPIIERINYLRSIVKNNEQAMLVFSAANLDFKNPANMRKAFGGKFPTEIHDAQIKGGKAEIAGGEQILAKLGQNQTLFNLGNDPRFQMMLSMIGSGPGVAVSTFERQVQQMAAPPKLLASGGKVTYARNGQLINFAPKGTDTVPAMLTPGEFVVNREASQKHLSLLHSINSNKDVLALNKGGYISPSYFETGGKAGSGASNLVYSLAPVISSLTDQIKSAIQDAFSQVVNTLESSEDRKPSNGVSNDSRRDLSRIESFSSSLNNLASRLENISIPPEIQFTGKQDVNVNVNGVQNLNIDSEAGKIAANILKNAINKLATNNPGTLDFNID